MTWLSVSGLWSVGRTRVKMGLKNRTDIEVTGEIREERIALRKARFKDTNPLACVRIVFWMDTRLVLWMAASPYAVYYCVHMSIPSIYKDMYNYNEFGIRLSYLPWRS